MAETVLVTGASSGIGRALAHQFAKNGYRLVAVAEVESTLKEAADEIHAQHGVEVHTIARDLTEDGAPRAIYDELTSKGIEIDVLVNDAGVGQRGDFVATPLDDLLRIIRLNVEALVTLTHLFGGDMVKRNRGRILNLGSVAGFQPGPHLAVYHATKAFVVSFSEALASELADRKSAVTVTCLCPGPTATDFFARADMEDTRAAKMASNPEKVAKAGYQALMSGERIHVLGASNKVLTFTRRVMPKALQARINKALYESSQSLEG